MIFSLLWFLSPCFSSLFFFSFLLNLFLFFFCRCHRLIFAICNIYLTTLDLPVSEIPLLQLERDELMTMNDDSDFSISFPFLFTSTLSFLSAPRCHPYHTRLMICGRGSAKNKIRFDASRSYFTLLFCFVLLFTFSIYIISVLLLSIFYFLVFLVPSCTPAGQWELKCAWQFAFLPLLSWVFI